MSKNCQTHFSVAWSRTGRKGPYAGYYLQIKPSGSFIGGGLWCPEAAPLAAMRKDIDRKSDKLKGVLLDPAMRKEFLSGISKDDKKAVKALVEQNKENALKTKPKVGSMKSSDWCIDMEIGGYLWPKQAVNSRLDAIRDSSPQIFHFPRPRCRYLFVLVDR